jgi:two-component system cell cycle response regulator
LTGVYSRPFLEKYLEERLAVAKSHHRHLALVFFSIPNIEGVREHFGDDAAEHLAQQLGQWITGLLRAEDLTALYAKNEFCVILPDTPLVEAEVVMHRIAGVLSYTDFAVREVYQPVKVWVQVACTDARPDDTLEGLLARAKAKLD